MNSLFQDTPAVAKGVFEGLGVEAATDVKALRIAKLEIDDEYDPEVHDRFFRTLSWADFSADEMGLMPTVISMGGDGATYDIGFGALSRVLSTTTPIKVVVLNSGAYSNTGGQASTASLTAQDSDLARFGGAHHGKQDERKELALIAAFHPNVYVVQSSAALQAHFLKHVVEFINHNDSPSVLDVYTPCQGEQGISDPQASRHARLAVVSRMNPVFVHDPRKGASLHDRFSLEGNPDVDKDWATGTIEHVENGQTKLFGVPMTPADFALTEGRFRKQFHRLKDGEAGAPVHEYIDLSAAEREGKRPFVWATDDEKRLIKMEVSDDIVHLVRERRRNWRSLQVLAGVDVEKLDHDHYAEMAALQAELKDATDARKSSINSIARAMSELAASSKAPPIAAFAPARALDPGALGPGHATPRRRARRGAVGCARAWRRRPAALLRGSRRREVLELQDLLPGDPGALREDQHRGRGRSEGGRASDCRRARQSEGHARSQGANRPRRRQLRLGDHP